METVALSVCFKFQAFVRFPPFSPEKLLSFLRTLGMEFTL